MARSPACASAAASACGPPAFSCQPAPTTSSRCVMMQPTRGFGAVVNKPRSARSSARRIMAWSKAENRLIGRALFLSLLRRLHFLQRIAEVVRRLEAAVHRSEADVGHLV